MAPARTEGERSRELRDAIRKRFDVPAADVRIVRAPLRICPLGAHIDHQLGVVTGMAIDQAVLLAFAPTHDGTVELESLNYAGGTRFSLRAIPAYARGDWGNYARGAALVMQERYRLAYGFRGLIASDMPVGGLSSSAAVTVAYLLALQIVNELEVAAAENIDLVAKTEQSYIGLQNGILDQTVILFSQAGSLTRIDCRDVTIEQVPSKLAPGSCEILVAYSGMSQGLMSTGYNDRVAQCQEAAVRLLAMAGDAVPVNPRLRHVPVEVMEEYGTHLPATLQKRARHYFGEMARVETGLAAWRRGDVVELGRQIDASGQSSVDCYECGSPPLISLFHILRNTPGVYGARFSGAGFRGSCIALIDPRARVEIVRAVASQYPRAHPDEAERYSLHFCRPGPHAALVGEDAAVDLGDA